MIISVQMTGYQQRPLYQADGTFVQQVRGVRNHLYQLCNQYRNQLVRIETLDGQVYIGRIVGCERGLLQISVRRPAGQPPYGGGGYPGWPGTGEPGWQGPGGPGWPGLGTEAPGAQRAFYGYDDMILTLVLYELLVITLLYT